MGVTAGPARTGSSPPSGGGTGDDAGEAVVEFDMDTLEGRVAYAVARQNGEIEAPPAREKVVVPDDELRAIAATIPGVRFVRARPLKSIAARVVRMIRSRPRERRGPSRSTRRARSAASSGSGSSDSDPPAAVAVSASLAGGA